MPLPKASVAKQRHLPRAPITEAVIDFQASLADDYKVESLLDVRSEIGDRYRRMTKQRHGEIRIELSEQIAEHRDVSVIGYMFESESGTDRAQFRLNGFTYNRLKPYTDWETVFKEAWELWTHYVHVANPEMITRLAVRYINVVELPEQIVELAEYLVSPPALPGSLDAQMERFLSRIHFRVPGSPASVILMQASKETGIILDIDAFMRVNLSPTDSSIPALFEGLRDLKNDVFFESVTEKTVELCL